MPKRKQRQPEPPGAEEFSQGEEEEQQGGSSHSSSDDDSDSSSDGFPSGDEGGSSSGESEDDEDGEAFDSINVDFEFYDPQENDFHGLKALLHTYLDGEQFSCSELVDAIIQQAAVGTVIKCGEDEDPIGVCTILNLQQHSKLKSLAELRSFLLAHCLDEAGKKALQKAWSAPGSGLVVAERLINCPPQLAPPLQRNLFEEVQAAAEEEETQELRDAFRFKRYILVARAYVDPEQQQEQQHKGGRASASGGAKQKQKDKRQKQAPLAAAAAPASSLVYATPEAESFHAHASWSFSFPAPNRPVGKGDLIPHRLVMGVEAAKVPAALRHLESLVAAGGGGSSD